MGLILLSKVSINLNYNKYFGGLHAKFIPTNEHAFEPQKIGVSSTALSKDWARAWHSQK